MRPYALAVKLGRQMEKDAATDKAEAGIGVAAAGPTPTRFASTATLVETDTTTPREHQRPSHPTPVSAKASPTKCDLAVSEAAVARRLVSVVEELIHELFDCAPKTTTNTLLRRANSAAKDELPPSPPASPVVFEDSLQRAASAAASPSSNREEPNTTTALSSSQTMTPAPESIPTDEPEFLPNLADFILRITTRTRIDLDCICLALLFCKRLKQKHPLCRGSRGTGHRLFLAGILTACKYLHDDAYENSAWAKASAGLFSCSEANHIEFEFLYYLDWELHVKHSDWEEIVGELETKMGGMPLRRFLQKNPGFDGYGSQDRGMQSATPESSRPNSSSTAIDTSSFNNVDILKVEKPTHHQRQHHHHSLHQQSQPVFVVPTAVLPQGVVPVTVVRPFAQPHPAYPLTHGGQVRQHHVQQHRLPHQPTVVKSHVVSQHRGSHQYLPAFAASQSVYQSGRSNGFEPAM